MRDLTKVIEEIIEVAPDLEKHLEGTLKALPYVAPELMSVHWSFVCKVLNEHASNHAKAEEIGDILNKE